MNDRVVITTRERRWRIRIPLWWAAGVAFAIAAGLHVGIWLGNYLRSVLR